MSVWKTWNLRTWNDRLLTHFFRSKDEYSEPVVILLTTADQLVIATDDHSADPDEVRDAFVRAVRTGIRHSESLLGDASNYEGWPNPPHWVAQPQFVAHLLFTCLAASESSDDLADEGSYVVRLRLLTEDQLPDNSLQWLPRLWEHLQGWLAANKAQYRPLILPTPGKFARIGYSVKLAFPDRRDQKELSELLDRSGLAGEVPPVGRVISLVSLERTLFRGSFLQAYDDFRKLYQSLATRTSSRLLEHRFWAAVREAAMRGRGETGIANVDCHMTLLGAEVDEQLSLFAVSDGQSAVTGLEFREFDVPYGEWRYYIEATDSIQGQPFEKIPRTILDGSLRVPRISTHVTQGLLAFVLGSHGLLELGDRERIAESSIVLVRTTLMSDLIRMFRIDSGRCRASKYVGWMEVHEPRLTSMPSEQFESTSLNRTWILHASLAPTLIRLTGGTRADGGWLGIRDALPVIVVPGAASVTLQGDDLDMSLKPGGDGTWMLPNQDLNGEFVLIATLDGHEDRRRVRFHSAPASESFKQPSDPNAWIVEEVSGTGTLQIDLPFTSEAQNSDLANFSERVTNLGPDVGSFVSDRERAAWRIVSFGDHLIGSRGELRNDFAVPSYWVESSNARRRWRKMLFECSPAESDLDFKEARRRVRGRALDGANLPRLNVVQEIPEVINVRFLRPLESVDRLLRIVAGRSATRAGIGWGEWSEIACRILGVDEPLLNKVTRAWTEAGLMDVASNARWRRRSLFARSPRLVAFKVGDHTHAVLDGLTMAAGVEELRNVAKRSGMLVEDRLSISQLVPSTITIRAFEQSAMRDFADRCHLKLVWLDMDRLLVGMPPRHSVNSPAPQNYACSTWHVWSLKPDLKHQLKFQYCTRQDKPSYWIVSAIEKQGWSYDLNIARCWASALVGEPIVRVIEHEIMESNHAFLPLPIARAVSIVGSGRSGPTGSTAYKYPIGSRPLVAAVGDLLARTFDPSHLNV